MAGQALPWPYSSQANLYAQGRDWGVPHRGGSQVGETILPKGQGCLARSGNPQWVTPEASATLTSMCHCNSCLRACLHRASPHGPSTTTLVCLV